ncbi:MAG TPA: recombinase XerD [Pseudolabrys sp.]|nr:recombinase XerD [Pseudolabrys sp.]
MLYRLVRPVRRKGTRNLSFVRRIPADVKRQAAGLKLAIPLGDATQFVTISARAQSVRLSLRTSDPREVKARQAAIDGYLETIWTALRSDAPVTVTAKQAHALAGELYRAWADEDRAVVTSIEHDPEFKFPDHVANSKWRRVRDLSQSERAAIWERISAQWDTLNPEDDGATFQEPSETEPPLRSKGAKPLMDMLRPIINRLLLRKGIVRIDEPSMALLVEAFWHALRDAFASRKRNAEGDYSPDPKAQRFPEWQSAAADRPVIAIGTSLSGLVQDWWREAQRTGRKPSTFESYSKTMEAFANFLGHDDAASVSKSDVVGFKEHRLGSINPRTKEPISPKTVKDSDLAGLKTVFAWAVTNGKLAANPAEGVTIKLGKRRKVRRGFRDAEATAVLRAALSVTRGRERAETYAAKRWVPWLLAYTGARVGEMAQLRKQDIHREGKRWVMTITPEAGTVKTDDARTVALHPHLVQQGFIKFVQRARAGYLFVHPSEGGDVRGPLQGLVNRLSEFVREVVPDRSVDPNHGWRHRFKTVCRAVSIDPEVRDYIQGHVPRSTGERYGEMPIQAVIEAINKLPRYKA